MRCPSCASHLRKPGDYCLVCHEGQTDAVLVRLGKERSLITMMAGEDVLGETTITTQRELADPAREVQRRNFAGRIADEIRRKRPASVYVSGNRELIGRLRGELDAEFYRLSGDDLVSAYRDRIAEPPLRVVDTAPADKIGGRHTTLIGDRRGRHVVRILAAHPHVKKIIPGPIDGSGSGSRSGFRAKVTRPDRGGNLRVLLHDGSTVQEVRLVTTAGSREDGTRIATQLNEALADDELAG